MKIIKTVSGLIIPNSTNFGNFVCLKLAVFQLPRDLVIIRILFRESLGYPI